MPNGRTGHAVSHATRSSKRKHRKSYISWAAEKSAKLAVWYALFIVVFRCPSSISDISSETPQLCTPYLHARSFIEPTITPYVDRYVTPYLQVAEPYLNQVRGKVYEPAFKAYQQYGAAYIAHAQELGQDQWQKTIKPQLQRAGSHAGKQLDATVGPHVKKVQEAVQPYLESVKTSASDIWELEVQPIYRHGAPYVENVYRHGHSFLVQTALPQAQYASGAAWSFWIKQIWPHLRVVYGENVEPQLQRISQRLSRYRDRKSLEADIASAESDTPVSSNTSHTSPLAVASSIYSAASRAAAVSSTGTVAPSETPIIESRTILEQFDDDLKGWEAICATAVREGALHLTDQISEIASSLLNSQVEGTGRALLSKLHNTADGATKSVKASILTIVSGLADNADDVELEQAHQAVISSVRSAGKSVKKSAQAIRDWRKVFNTELDELVLKAYESTLETVDNVRELRLSDIGRRYADKGLPHKMWSRYNDLKKSTKAWRNDIQKAALGHADLGNTKAAAEDIESNGMGIAEETAEELGRLRDVGKWKVTAGDAEDDFTSKTLPAAAERARKRVAEKIADASQAVVEGATVDILGNANSIASGASSAVGSIASSVSEVVVASPSAAIKDAAEKVSSVVIGSQQPAGESVISEASKSVSSVASAAADAAVGASAVISKAAEHGVESAASAYSNAASSGSSIASSLYKSVESSASAISLAASDVASSGSQTAKSVASDVSAVIIGTKSKLTDTILDAAKSVSAAVIGTESSLSDTVTDAWSTASSSVASAASAVSSQLSSIIPEDIASSASASLASVASDVSASAESAASSLSEQYDSVKTKASSKIFVGAMAQVIVEAREPIMDEPFEDDIQDQSATYSDTVQSIISQAGEKASDLTRAVLEAFAAATPTTKGTIESASSIASQRYESALSAASSVLLNAQGSVSTGSVAAEKLYRDAVSAASKAIYGPAITDSPYAVVSSRLLQAQSLASSQYSAAISRISAQISGTPLPAHQQMFASVESAYSAALSGGSVRLAAVAAALPTQNPFAVSKGFYESISSVASSRLAEGLATASVQYQNAKIAVGAEPTPVHQAYLASAQRAYYEGIGAAHDQYSSFLEAASSAVGVSPTTGYRAYLAAAQNTYSAAVAAASSTLQELVASASSAAGVKSTSPAESLLSSISSQYNLAYSAASSQLLAASSQASAAVIGTEKGAVEKATDAAASAYNEAASQVSAAIYGTATPWTEAMFSQAADNWNSLIADASGRIYGTPAPLTDVVYSSASSYAAVATDAAVAQFAAVQALFQEVIGGREPDFSESMMNRLQSAYLTGAPALASSASSYASAAWETAASAVYSVFTPPAQLDSLLAQVNEQLDSAVSAASSQLYGSSTGVIESATSAVASAAGSAYSDASSRIDQLVNGSPVGYAEAAQVTMAAVGASASKAISEALFGTPVNSVEAVQNSAASVYTSMSSIAVEQAAAASAAISRALYGEEKSYAEKLEIQVNAAISSAQSRISELALAASKVAVDSVSTVTEAAIDVASSASSIASSIASVAAESASPAVEVIDSAASSASSVASGVASVAGDSIGAATEAVISAASSASSAASSVASAASAYVHEEL